eukprot:Platyproteum_vivax@DN603_c0_g1_i1.p1
MGSRNDNDFLDTPDDWELTPGSVKKGSKLFKKHCAACHSDEPFIRGCYKISAGSGPTMWNVVYRTAGRAEDGDFLTDSMRDSGIVWTDNNLMRYMKKPAAFTGQTPNMVFKGIKDYQTRVDILHFLHTLTPQYVAKKQREKEAKEAAEKATKAP